WHDRMQPFESLRDELRSREQLFEILDAVQLVKHAFGLVTEGRRKQKRPYLVYLFAEPERYSGRPIKPTLTAKHRAEILKFAGRVAGAEVGFGAISYREWMQTWPTSNLELENHRAAIVDRFQP